MRAQQQLSEFERPLGTNTPGAERAGLSFEQVPAGRVVQVNRVAVRKHEFNAAHRIVRAGTLHQRVGKIISGQAVPVDRGRIDLVAIAIIHVEAPLDEIGSILFELRQDVAGRNTPRHCPCRIDGEVGNLVTEDRRLVVRPANLHTCGPDPVTALHHIGLESGDIDDHHVIFEIVG